MKETLLRSKEMVLSETAIPSKLRLSNYSNYKLGTHVFYPNSSPHGSNHRNSRSTSSPSCLTSLKMLTPLLLDAHSNKIHRWQENFQPRNSNNHRLLHLRRSLTGIANSPKIILPRFFRVGNAVVIVGNGLTKAVVCSSHAYRGGILYYSTKDVLLK